MNSEIIQRDIDRIIALLAITAKLPFALTLDDALKIAVDTLTLIETKAEARHAATA